MRDRIVLLLGEYEASNLRWLLRQAQESPANTGDWCGQILFQLEDEIRVWLKGPFRGPCMPEGELQQPNSSDPLDIRWRR